MSKQTLHEANILDLDSRMDYEIGSVRSAYGDIAGLCDSIARDIEDEYTKRGRIMKEGQALAAIARRCGDAAWNMRKKINRPGD